MDATIVTAVVVTALVFAYTNGFHDAPNAIATSVSTRALTPRVAVTMAALMNFLGAFLGQRVAQTVSEIIDPPTSTSGLIIVLAGLIGATVWNLITWYAGMPTSSSHALIGGLVGAALVAGVSVRWQVVWDRVVVWMLLAPALAFCLALLAMMVIARIFADTDRVQAAGGFRLAQTASAAAMALGHGLQDAQKTMGVVFLALVTGGYADAGDGLPWWVVVAAALALSLGTLAGGWRITRTLGRRIATLEPPGGFASEAVAAAVLYLAAYAFHAPVSTTHAITSAIAGSAASRRLSAIRWWVARSIVAAWVLTVPLAGLCAAAVFWPLSRLV